MQPHDNQTAAGALAIRNVGVLYQAHKLLDKIQDEIYDATANLMKRLLGDDAWILKDLEEEDAFWIKDWNHPDSTTDFSACFWIWSENPKCDDYEYHVTRLCGHGQGEVGISWDVQLGKGRRWKNEIADKYANKTGRFKYHAKLGCWFLPIKIDADILADQYVANAIEDSLQPILEEAVKEIKKCLPAFNAIIEEARSDSPNGNRRGTAKPGQNGLSKK